MCVALFEPANTKVGTLKHIPRALTLGGHGHVSGVMWASIQAPEGQHAPSPVCTSEHLLCPQPCDGLPRRPGRWRQHTSPGPVRRGRRGGGGPGDELPGKEPGHPRSCPLSMQPWPPPLLRNLL